MCRICYLIIIEDAGIGTYGESMRRSTRITVIDAAEEVVAAPNPFTGQTSTQPVTIAGDGSYRVHIDETMELARDFEFSFGGIVHDGFRLPDTGSVLPPYLRTQYSRPAITMDGESAEVAVEHTNHAVDISATDVFSQGEHNGIVKHLVTGAAVGPEHAPAGAGHAPARAGEGVTVYLRPLVPGDIVVKSAVPIEGVVCEDWSPDGRQCGHRTGDDWLIGSDELGGAGLVRVGLDADESELIAPTIDSSG